MVDRLRRLTADFSCALQREILVHGRLYVSQNFISFYSNIFGFETMLSIPYLDIISIQKQKVALLVACPTLLTPSFPMPLKSS